MALSWKFIFARRGIKLEQYVSDCRTVEEALIKFERDDIDPPTEDEIAAVLPVSTVSTEPSKKPVKTPPPKKVEKAEVEDTKSDQRLVESPRQLDDLIIL